VSWQMICARGPFDGSQTSASSDITRAPRLREAGCLAIEDLALTCQCCTVNADRSINSCMRVACRSTRRVIDQRMLPPGPKAIELCSIAYSQGVDA